MQLSQGTRLGPYAILGPFGAGGQGEVYRATDTRLGRSVAIKCVKGDLGSDPPHRARVEREARIVAQLSHPNICALHDILQEDGHTYLVMEALEGQTLATRLLGRNGRGLPRQEALTIVAAVADGLAFAHQHGVVHQDVKPSNIMLTPSGVKLLDFGIARLRRAGQDLNVTLTAPVDEGSPSGTLPYMAPEQLRGEVDARSDLFAVGAVLYEMLTGRRAFVADSPSALAARITEHDPPVLSPEVSTPALARLVAKCLARDPARRWQTAADLADELRWLAGTLDQSVAPTASGLWRRGALVVVWLVAGIAGLIAGWLLLGRDWREAPVAAEVPRQVVRFQITNPMPAMPRPELAHQSVAITRDGSMIAYGTPSEDRTAPGGRLYLRSLDGTTRPASELVYAFTPAFSPAGDRLAFRVGCCDYYVTSVKGGAPVLAMEPVLGSISTAAWWGQDGLVYENFGTLYRKKLSGPPEVFAKPDAAKRETYYYGASATPDGKAIVFTIVREDTESFDRAVIAVKDLETGVQKVLISGGMSPQVTTTGHLLFGRAGSLHAVAIDTSRWEVRGSPVAVVDDIVTEPADGLTPYAISDNGTLVYLQGGAQRYRRQVVVFDRRGRETPLLESGPYNFVRASPTGEYVALSAYGANVRTWLFDLRRQTLGLLTETWSNEGPAWSHDGTRLAHSSTRGGETALYVAGVLSPSETKLQGGSEISSIKAFSADDRYVLVFDFGDIFRIRSDGSGGKEALVTSGAREAAPDASPDGTWLAFQSDDTGRFEVYVVPYASGGRRQQVSRNGGSYPRWTMRGRELCYRAGLAMSSIACVAIGPDGSAVGESRVVVNLDDTITSWDVSPDGQHFYVIKNAIEGWQPTAPLQVVVNWFDELRAKLARSEK